MKITGPDRISPKSVQKAGRRRTAGSGTAFSEALGEAEQKGSSIPVSGAAPLAQLDALLSLQEVPDAATGRSKGLRRAEDMLDVLEGIRRAILLGAIPAMQLRSLAGLARDHRTRTDDTRLDDILGEIELRAEVELAKYGF